MTDPIAFRFGPLEIRWYGIFAALAFLVGYSFVKFRARTRQFRPELIDRLLFWVLIGGVIGARFMYVVTHFSEFRGRWLETLMVWQGGLVFYGGFVGAFVAAYVVAVLENMDKGALADLLAPALPLGHAVGRIGCFLNGCCFGKPYHGPLAVEYPPDSAVNFVQKELGHLSIAAQECLPVFPVQLLASATNLLIFAMLLLIEPRLKAKGQLLALYVMLYSIIRFLTEFMRGDYLQRFGGLTSAQILCLILLPTGVAAYAVLGRKLNTDDSSI